MADLLLVVELCVGEPRRAKAGRDQKRTIIFSTIPLKTVVNIQMRKAVLELTKPCLAIEIAEFAILRLDLPCIDLGMVSEYILPPLHLVHFLEVKLNRRLIL